MSRRKASAQQCPVTIDVASSTPVYRQIVDDIRMHLVDGAIAAGAPLPSMRRMATELNIHFNTVADAYRELAKEGWIELRHGKAAMVLARQSPAALRREKLDGFRQRLRQLAAQMKAEGVPAPKISSELKLLAERFQS